MGLRRPHLLLRGVAALWGFAEATLFFIVPDVLPSLVAARTGELRGVVVLLLAARIHPYLRATQDAPLHPDLGSGAGYAIYIKRAAASNRK